MILIFDYTGTLAGNIGGLSDDEVYDIVERLSTNHAIVIWTGDVLGVPMRWARLARTIVTKPDTPQIDWRQAVLVDDDPRMLSLGRRLRAALVLRADHLQLLELLDYDLVQQRRAA